MKTTPSFTDRLQFLALGPRDWLVQIICCRYETFLWGFSMMLPKWMDWSSRLRARRATYRAAHAVPAFAEHLANAPVETSVVPEMDKASYVKAHSTEARCRDGELPLTRVMIDESSGSTGTPYNWVRTRRERLESQRFISYFAKYCYGTEPRITINAFSMGAWATGINMGQAMEFNGVVKNTGPDVGKILSTLRFFGPKYPYLILGYPPFLKRLIDVAEEENFPFAEYRLDALVGGEGMSEGLRDYLQTRFGKVFSGYGATDLEIGIAGETPIAVALRRLAWKNPEVKRALFGDDSRLPMLFQYNPLMHHVEVNENPGSLIRAYEAATGQIVPRPDGRRVSLNLTRDSFTLPDTYRPPAEKNILLLLPCSKDKPYKSARSHQAIRGAVPDQRVHVVTISGLYGPVPEELEDRPEVLLYDYILSPEAKDQMDEVTRRLVEYLRRHGTKYKFIAAYVTSRAYRTVASRALKLYGRGLLLPSNPKEQTSKEFLRWENVNELRDHVARCNGRKVADQLILAM